MEQLFRFVSSLPVPLWLAMILAPRSAITRRAARSSTLFSLAAANYVLSLLVALRRGGGQGQLPDFTSLAGIQAGFGTPEGALGAWAHMTALDLFTGAWIYRQSVRLQAPAWVRVLALLLTWFAGPLGLLIFLLWRLAGGREEALRGYPQAVLEA